MPRTATTYEPLNVANLNYTVIPGQEEKVFKGNREAWCLKVLDYLEKELAPTGIRMPIERKIKISIAPITRPNTLGICYPSGHSPNGDVNHIVISPVQAKEIELVHTICHEYLHAVDDCVSRHKGRWERMANIFGMQSKGHERNSDATRLFNNAIATIGHLKEHELQVMKKKTRDPSLQKVACPECGRTAYVPFKLFQAEGKSHLICKQDKLEYTIAK